MNYYLPTFSLYGDIFYAEDQSGEISDQVARAIFGDKTEELLNRLAYEVGFDLDINVEMDVDFDEGGRPYKVAEIEVSCEGYETVKLDDDLAKKVFGLMQNQIREIF